MLKLIPFLKNYKKESIIGPLFKLMEVCFELLVPIVIAQIIDIGIDRQDTAYIMRRGGVLLLLSVLGFSCTVVAQFFAAKASVGFGTELRHALFQKINGFSYSTLDKVGSSTLITRLTADINQVQTGVNLILRLFLRAPFVVIGALVMSFSIDRKASIIFLLTIILLIIAIYFVMVWTVPRYKKIQEKLDRILLMTSENLTGIRVVRAFRTQATEEKAFVQENEGLIERQIQAGRLSALLNPLTFGLVNLGIVLLLWQGSGWVYEGTISQGQLIALINYMMQILLALLAIFLLIINTSKAMASGARIQEVLSLPSAFYDGRKEKKSGEQWGIDTISEIAFEKVDFSYSQEPKPVLTDVSFKARKGELIGIIGGTGSGKSTMMNLIPKFYQPSKGEIKINGEPIEALKTDKLREVIGIVPQKSVLFRGTIESNLKMGNENASTGEMAEAIEKALVSEVLEDKPLGLQEPVSELGRNFSGGQRARLCIARALVKNPQILILDDSTAALDFATEAKLLKCLREGREDRITFLLSQRASSLRLADQILVLENGSLVGNGNHEYLLKNCEIYREICDSQGLLEEVEVG